MDYIRKVEIKEFSIPVDGYCYDAQIWGSVDGGKTWWYCGHGKFFRTLAEAEAYKLEVEGKG